MGHCLFMRKGETHTAPIAGILASDLAVGSSVYLMENGVAVEYLVVNQGKPSGSSLYDDSCDGTWLLRKDIKENRQWNSSNVNDYANSTIHAWLNGDFFNQFGTVEQATIKQVKIPYVKGTGDTGSISSGLNGLVTKVFLISADEAGFNFSQMKSGEGSELSYFFESPDDQGDGRRIASLDGIQSQWWMRSPRDAYNYLSLAVNIYGYRSIEHCIDQIGVRPALILPSTALFDTNTLILKGVA